MFLKPINKFSAHRLKYILCSVKIGEQTPAMTAGK